jgi:hypothetical protein
VATTRTVIFNFKTTGVNIADQMKKSGDAVVKAQEKMTTAGLTLTKTVTAPILGLGVAAVKMASDMEETMNKVDVSFGDSAQQVKDWAKDSINSMGLAQQSALDTAALFGDMGTGMGLTEQKAANMATSLTQLSADLASFKNVRQDVAATALNGIFTGETESLKQLGIVMTEANLQEFALEQGISKRVSEMSQAEKVQLRYNYVMNATTKAQGDFERTGGGMANQSRKMSEQLKELGVQFGTLLLPIATKIVTKLNEMLTTWNSLSPTMQKIILTVVGIVAAIGPLLLIVSKVIGIISKLKTIFLVVKGVMMAFGASALVPFLPIIAIVGAIIAVIILLVKHWDKVKAVAVAVGNKIKEMFMSIWEKIKFVVGKIKNAFSTVKEAIITAFTAVKTFIKSVFTTIGNIIKAPINAIIKGINKVLKTINKIKIPDWVPLIGGKSANFSMIPTLASGGIVNSATQAIIGEGADPEAVVPLNPKSISNFVSGLGMGGGTGSTININVPQQNVALVDLNGNKLGNILLPQITRKLKLGGALT